MWYHCNILKYNLLVLSIFRNKQFCLQNPNIETRFSLLFVIKKIKETSNEIKCIY